MTNSWAGQNLKRAMKRITALIAASMMLCGTSYAGNTADDLRDGMYRVCWQALMKAVKVEGLNAPFDIKDVCLCQAHAMTKPENLDALKAWESTWDTCLAANAKGGK